MVVVVWRGGELLECPESLFNAGLAGFRHYLKNAAKKRPVIFFNFFLKSYWPPKSADYCAHPADDRSDGIDLKRTNKSGLKYPVKNLDSRLVRIEKVFWESHSGFVDIGKIQNARLEMTTNSNCWIVRFLSILIF